MLAFYPFFFWPLCFVALVPALYASITSASYWRVFAGGCIAYGMLCFTFSFLLAVQFHWLPATELFSTVVKVGGVAAAVLVYGTLFGVWLCVYRFLRGSSLLLNSAVGAALYCIAEYIAHGLVGGYFLGAFSHAVIDATSVSWVASLGGTLLVSFVVVFINVCIGEALYARHDRQKLLMGLAVPPALLLVLFTLHTVVWSSERDAVDAQPFSVAVVSGGYEEKKIFSEGRVQVPARLQEALQKPVDLVVYPDSPVSGFVSATQSVSPTPSFEVLPEDRLRGWMHQAVSRDTTLMVWENVLGSEGTIATQFDFWKRGTLAGTVGKRALLPFMDYQPAWARSIGLYSMPFDVVATSTSPVSLQGVRIEGLVCSEVHRSGLARSKAQQASLLIAAGSEGMFEDDAISHFSLVAARYRAIENNIPVIRASLQGPSAIIDGRGRILAFAPWGESTVLYHTFTLGSTMPSLYMKLGIVPVIVLCLGILGAVLFMRRARSLDTKGQS